MKINNIKRVQSIESDYPEHTFRAHGFEVFEKIVGLYLINQSLYSVERVVNDHLVDIIEQVTKKAYTSGKRLNISPEELNDMFVKVRTNTNGGFYAIGCKPTVGYGGKMIHLEFIERTDLSNLAGSLDEYLEKLVPKISTLEEKQ